MSRLKAVVRAIGTGLMVLMSLATLASIGWMFVALWTYVTPECPSCGPMWALGFLGLLFGYVGLIKIVVLIAEWAER